MSFINGLHGTVAAILICALLFVDEAGVPLPFVPNEVLLIFAGLLIGSGGMSPFVFIPLALAAMIGGCFTGYTWARAVGPGQLRTIAERLRATRAFDRATTRMRDADVRHVAITRLIPGIRVYATLAAGAAGADVRKFMRGSVIALVIWTFLITGLGYVVGVPAEHLLSRVERLAFSGAILVVLGFLGYRAARTSPRGGRGVGPFSGFRMSFRYVLAVAVDAGVIATITAGFDRLTRSILHIRSQSNLVDSGIVIAAIGLSYIVASRRSGGETAGERLFDVSYVHPHHH